MKIQFWILILLMILTFFYIMGMSFILIQYFDTNEAIVGGVIIFILNLFLFYPYSIIINRFFKEC